MTRRTVRRTRRDGRGHRARAVPPPATDSPSAFGHGREPPGYSGYSGYSVYSGYLVTQVTLLAPSPPSRPRAQAVAANRVLCPMRAPRRPARNALHARCHFANPPLARRCSRSPPPHPRCNFAACPIGPVCLWAISRCRSLWRGAAEVPDKSSESAESAV